MSYERFADSEIVAQQRRIAEQEVETHPLVSVSLPMTRLRTEYANADASFVTKIDSLTSQGCDRYRACRGDGNCMYRAYSFAVLETLHAHVIASQNANDIKQEPNPILKHFAVDALQSRWRAQLERGGYEWETVEFFWDPFASLLLSLGSLTSQQLLQRFQESECADSTVVLFRFLASSWIKAHREEVLPFLAADLDNSNCAEDIDEYCATEIDAFGREAGEIAVIALVNAVQIPCDIAYLDRSGTHEGKINFHSFTPQNPLFKDTVLMLYRPGHYDILYNANV